MADLSKMFGTAGGDSFLGLPTATAESFAGDIALFGADACTSYASVGAYCAGAPAAIRAASAQFSANLGHVNFDLGGPMLPRGVTAFDLGDLPQVDGEGAANRARIGATARAVIAAGGVPVLLGGDDSVPQPLIEALAEAGDLWILQIDAHIDWREEVEGEPLGLSSTMRRASELPGVKGIVQVGQRGIGSARPGDLQDALDWGVQFVGARGLARGGKPALDRVAALFPAGARVVVCLDLDALDPAVMPAVIARTAGGLGYWDVVELVAAVAARARLVGLDMVEFMPAQDVAGQGALTAAELLAALVGIVARQREGLYQGAERLG